jgi:tripartite-type tricarboxylate transporter receptor subunit TctC
MRTTLHGALAALLVLAAGSAAAQAWPNKPIRVIVNVAAGGVADRTARMLGVPLAEALGQPVVVENRGGGEGYIGAEAVARADDGHTLLFTPGSQVMITPHIVGRTDFVPSQALVPIAPTVRLTMYLVVHPSVPVNNVQEFVRHAQANPGKLNYGSAGTGTALHIAAEMMKREAKFDATHVPYKGAGPALQDLIGGQVQFIFDPGVALGHAKDGRVKLLGLSGNQRHPDFPNVTTFAEAGYTSVDGGPFFGFYAPKGTPAAVVQRVNAEVTKAVTAPDMRKRLEATGLEITTMSPDQFSAYVRDELVRWAKLVDELGLRKK